MKKTYFVLWLLFWVFVVVRVLCQMQYWIVLSLETCALAITLLFKVGKPSKKYIYLAGIFAVLSTVAYLGYQRNPWILLYGLRAGVPTFLCSLAAFSVSEKKEEYSLVSRSGRHPLVISVLIGFMVGALLSVVNILISGKSVSFDFSLWKILLCFNPAIYEEMACRAIFMAFCIWCSDGEMNLFQKTTMYFMMCVPHAAVHGYPLMETIVLSVLFGLPFAILQKKRDIASAMISHGVVDAIRFILTGI